MAISPKSDATPTYRVYRLQTLYVLSPNIITSKTQFGSHRPPDRCRGNLPVRGSDSAGDSHRNVKKM